MTASPLRRISDALRLRTCAIAVVVAVTLVAPYPARAILANNENAIDILGQFASPSSDATPNYTQSAINDNNGATPSALGMNGPQAAVLDAVNHRLFASDTVNNRVLVFNLNTDNSFPDHTADNVLGQPNFSSHNTNTSVSGMQSPSGLAFDSVHNRLFVADYINSRVIVFDASGITNGMNAANVLGEANFNTNTTHTTQSGTKNPSGLCYDSVSDRLFVSDSGNNRVLVFDTSSISNGMNAANVLGQTNFTNGGTATTQSGMSFPGGCTVDSTNKRLFVADQDNNRVLVFDTSSISDGMNASFELGQASGGAAFTSGTTGLTQSRMNDPDLISFDPVNNRLFVADSGNNRVLVFNVAARVIANGMNAANVLGQANFTSKASVTTRSGLATSPSSAYYDPGSHNMFVADTGNNRVMIFDGSFLPPAEYFNP